MHHTPHTLEAFAVGNSMQASNFGTQSTPEKKSVSSIASANLPSNTNTVMNDWSSIHISDVKFVDQHSGIAQAISFN